MTDEETALVRAAGFDLLLSGFKDAQLANKAELARRMPVGDRRGVVLLIDGNPVRVATVTHVNGSGPRVRAVMRDPDAFAEWARQENPHAVETVAVVSPWFEQEAIARAVRTGEAIPGVDLVEAEGTQPYVKVARDKTPEARAALLGAIFENNAAGLRALLAIEPGTEQE